MGKIRVIVNRESNTLDVWFDDPEKEFISEETGELARAIMLNDNNEVVDALVDLIYFILGTGVVLGVNLETEFAKVHEQNMKKPLKKSEAGKLLKK